MKIALLGYGKMGKAIESIALERNHSVVFKTNADFDSSLIEGVDVAIEFSLPQFAVNNIKKCFSVNVPIVVGTTGWYNDFDSVSKECLSTNNSLFYATNYSVGVNIFFEINKTLAKLMNNQPTYDVSMKEIHHIHKLDAPSGTGITLAEQIISNVDRKQSWIEGKGNMNELSIESFREGEVPGTHIVKYESEIDTIEIMHEAKGRKGFALGAVLAAEFLQGKKGVYTMKDMLKL